MDDWIPRLASGLQLEGLRLDPEEGFVLSRLDGDTPISRLPFLTGLGADKIASIVDRLVDLGAVVARPEPQDPIDDPDEKEESSSSVSADDARWRRRYHEQFRQRDQDERVELARRAQGADLLALCFDPSSKVVRAVLENASVGLDHARLVARHHRSSLGLDALGHDVQFLRDAQVRRLLYRNSQTSDRILHRLFERQRIAALYQLAAGHEATDRVRAVAKKTFRRRFGTGTAEERVHLILKTDGRCLSLLVGTSLDAKATALLTRRSLGSTLLIRNLLRWPATPPPLLAHLAKQPVVLRNVQLKNLVQRHPNASGLHL